MASRALVSAALLILFFTLVSCQTPTRKPPITPSLKPTQTTPELSQSLLVKRKVIYKTITKTITKASPPPPPPVGCPRDTLKVRLCANVLGGLVNVVLGPQNPCCSLVQGLLDLDAAVCLCTVIKVDVLGIINLQVPVDLSVLLNSCGKELPQGFKCVPTN
ncbi:hypothetical protein Tsubulata_043877 [Turnera subulata]|uniref:Bifunctional inhibitor/plant lipid transfer protein/seed storage helical domain-containing protein n=1 Tax=Turnera subulata TaxID=218843 RepID=A0A9Q0IWW2_9ROSI|nr:hypothetical protein Tsubulata_043877 [Turnera subulata]